MASWTNRRITGSLVAGELVLLGMLLGNRVKQASKEACSRVQTAGRQVRSDMRKVNVNPTFWAQLEKQEGRRCCSRRSFLAACAPSCSPLVPLDLLPSSLTVFLSLFSPVLGLSSRPALPGRPEWQGRPLRHGAGACP